MAAAAPCLRSSICYEDAYGSAELAALRAGATLLVNVTNDAWFGHSWARYQHFQIARMRALEAQRPLMRAANDGISALVGRDGEVLARAPEFQATVLRGSVQPRAGLPPLRPPRQRPGVVLPALLAALLAVHRGRRGAGARRGRRSRPSAEAGTAYAFRVYHCISFSIGSE